MKLLKIEETQSILLELMKKVHNFMNDNDLKYYMLGGSALGAIRHEGFIPWDDDIDIGMYRDDYERFLTLTSDFDSNYDIVNFKNSNNCDFCLTRIYIPNTYVDNPTIKKTKLDKRLYFDIFPLDNVPDSNDELKKYENKIIKKKHLIARIDVKDYHNSKMILIVKKMISMLLKPQRQTILTKTDRLMKKYRYQCTEHICSLSSQYSFARQVMDKKVYGTPILHTFCDLQFYVPEQVHEYLTILFGADYMEIPPAEKRRKGYNIYLVKEK